MKQLLKFSALWLMSESVIIASLTSARCLNVTIHGFNLISSVKGSNSTLMASLCVKRPSGPLISTKLIYVYHMVVL